MRATAAELRDRRRLLDEKVGQDTSRLRRARNSCLAYGLGLFAGNVHEGELLPTVDRVLVLAVEGQDRHVDAMSTPPESVAELPRGEPDAEALEVAASTRSKRPTRRGRGGSKKEEKEPRIEIPCLKFKVKDKKNEGKDADWGTLKDLKCTTTYEVKIVGIKGRTTTDTTLRSVTCLYPGADDRLVPGNLSFRAVCLSIDVNSPGAPMPGSDCWVLPHLKKLKTDRDHLLQSYVARPLNSFHLKQMTVPYRVRTPCHTVS